MKRLLPAVVILCFFAVTVHAQVTVKLSPAARQQFFDANGLILSAGCVYTYAGGTTTFLATYTDSTGTTQNTDPIQLDTSGSANIWLTGSAYKFAVYENASGGACPGTPGGSLALLWTVDNITTATGSGSGAATSVVSAGANPATSGIIEMTKSDTICWRNVGNSGNLCASIDGANNLTWQGGSLALSEIAAPSGVSGEDIIWADANAHRLKQSGNGGAAVQLVNAGVDINTSDQVTATHLASALPVAQGGTGQTTLTGLPITNAALTTPKIGGTTITNVPELYYTSFALNDGFVAGFILSTVDTNQGGIKVLSFRLNESTTPTGCSTTGQFELFDETAGALVANSLITEVNGTNSQGVTVNTTVPASHVLDMRSARQSVGCSPQGANINLAATYLMQ